jgi:hypothetical protein
MPIRGPDCAPFDTADVGVEHRNGVNARPLWGLAIELVVEDRTHRAVGQRADLDSVHRRRFDPIGAKRPHQAHDAEAGTEPLLGMGTALQDQFA